MLMSVITVMLLVGSAGATSGAPAQVAQMTMAPSGDIGRVTVLGPALSVPEKMNVQGYMTASDPKDTLTGAHPMRFGLWTTASGGSELWNWSGSLQFQAGLFSTTLSIPASHFASGDPRWLEVQVESQTLSPRVEVTSAAFAYRSIKSDTASYASSANIPDGSVTTAKLADNVVTSAKIADGTIAAGDIGSGAVATAKIAANAVTTAKIERNANSGYVLTSNGGGSDPSWQTVPSAPSHQGDVTGPHNATVISTGAVTSAKIQDGTVAAADLATTGVSSGTYGDATHVGQFTVNTKGQLTSASSVALDVPSHDHTASGDVTGTVTGTLNIASYAVTTTKIATSAVTEAKIADDAVSYGKLENPFMVSGDQYFQRSSGYPTVSVRNTATSGDADALYARSLSSNSSGTWCLSAVTQRGIAIYAQKNYDDGAYALYVDASGSGASAEGIYTDGRLVADGGKSTVVRTSRGKEALFCIESPEEEFYSCGSAKLVGGVAEVAFDRLYSEAVSAQIPLRIIVTPKDEWSGIYATSVTTRGFVARAGAGSMESSFDWIAVGRRKGSEVRPIVPIPTDAQLEAMRAKSTRIAAQE